MKREVALKIENIHFTYGSTPVLKDVCFGARAGEVCALLGPNGSGKTTLLKCINGICRAGGGRIQIDGRDVASLTQRQIASHVSLVPQQTNVAFSFTAHQMVLMGRTARLGFLEVPGERDRREAAEALEELEIGHLIQRRFNELSGGERQMVLLARALFQSPRILLLDEPTSHLDFRNQHRIMEHIGDITRSRGLTTLVTLHDPNTACRYCERMVLLKQGRVLNRGAREEIFDARNLGAIYGMSVRIEQTPGGTSVVLPAPEGHK